MIAERELYIHMHVCVYIYYKFGGKKIFGVVIILKFMVFN